MSAPRDDAEPLPTVPTSLEIVRRLIDAENDALLRFFPRGVVFAFDEELRYTSIGGLALVDVGLSRSALEGHTLFEVFPPETCEAVAPSYRAALSGQSSSIDVTYQGHIFHQRLAPVLNPAGNVIAGIGFSEDVTLEREAQRLLQESETRMRLTMTNAPIGEALVELDGRWRTVNPALVKLLGYAESELLQLTFQDITHPDDLDLDLDQLRHLVAGDINAYEMEKRYFTSTGSLVWVLLSVSLVRDQDGEPLYFISQIVDITERNRQQDALRQLTAMLSHDLRTPVTVIRGFAEVMTSEWDKFSDPERRQAFTRVLSAARALQGLLDSSLTASTLDGGGLQAKPAPINLSAAVKDALVAVPHPGIHVRTDDFAGASVWFDRGHLTQILTNLITNAVKYGGDELSFAADAASTRVTLTIADNGPGVPATFVSRLFDRYSRAETATTTQQNGSGLGLSIVKDLIELNGGTVRYDDTPTRGASFILDLPRATSPQGRDPGPLPSPST